MEVDMQSPTHEVDSEEEETSPTEKKGIRGFWDKHRTIIGAFIYSLALGSFNAWGNIIIYLVSWQKETQEWLKLKDLALIVPICLIAVYVMISLSLKIGARVGYKRTLIICGIMFPGGIFVSSFITVFWGFLLIYATVACVFMGAAFMIPMYSGWEKYPDKERGRVTGIVTCAFSLSPFVFNYLALWTANPQNLEPDKTFPEDEDKYFDKEVSSKVPWMLQSQAIVLCALCMIGAFMIETPNEDEEEDSDEDSDDEEKEAANKAQPMSQKMKKESVRSIVSHGGTRTTLTFKKAVVSWDFWKLYLMNFLGLLTPQFLVMFYKSYGLSKEHSDAFVTTVGAIGSLMSAAAGLVVGYLADRFEFIKIANIMYFILLGCSVALAFMAESRVFFFIFTVIVYGGIGGSSGLYPIEISKIFGNRVGGQLYGINATANVMAFIFIVGVIFVLKEAIGYDYILLMLAGGIAGSLVLGLGYNAKGTKKPKSMKKLKSKQSVKSENY